MAGKKLKNAPLKEVSFELFWKVSANETRMPHDPGYQFALGRFHQAIKGDFAVRKRILPPGVVMYPKAEFQFWTRERVWPVVQFGPGVLTVNDTEGTYTWDDYRNKIIKVVRALIESYDSQLKFDVCRLQYLDAIDLLTPGVNVEEHIAKNHQTSINTKYDLPGSFKGLSITQTRLLPDDSTLKVDIKTARNTLKNVPSIVWTTSIERRKQVNEEELLSWLDRAHSVASDTFVKMLKPEFYELLDK